MKSFSDLNLNPVLAQSLQDMQYSAPTPIQAQSIPLALEGHDIMGSAQTGTGKTAAFAIPVIEKLLEDPRNSALVLTPTRELGKQIMDIMHQLIGQSRNIKTAFIIGGEAMDKQLRQLKKRPRLIVGTPGRINDHLDRGTMDIETTNFLVLDETDRMLDMGFAVQLDTIFEHMPAKRQTMMFSATLPPNIMKMSEKYLNNPKRVSVGAVNVVATKIKQEVIRIEQGEKYNELLAQLHDRTGSVIVFVKTKHSADRMADKLRRDGFTSDALHGDLRQRKRDQVMVNFRNKNFRVLIATDIAARGLDVPHIEHVINYDLPQVAEDFIHRMGRTARAGAEGSAISFVASQDGRKWHAIARLLDPNAANDSEQNGQSKKGKGKHKGSPHVTGKKPRRSGGKPDYKKSGDGKFSNKKPAGKGKPYSKDTEGKKPFKKKFDGKKDRSETERSRSSDRPFKKKFDNKRGKPDSEQGQSSGKPFKKKFDGKRGKPTGSDNRNTADKPYNKKPRSNNGNDSMQRKKRPDMPKRKGPPKSARPKKGAA